MAAGLDQKHIPSPNILFDTNACLPITKGRDGGLAQFLTNIFSNFLSQRSVGIPRKQFEITWHVVGLLPERNSNFMMPNGIQKKIKEKLMRKSVACQLTFQKSDWQGFRRGFMKDGVMGQLGGPHWNIKDVPLGIVL